MADIKNLLQRAQDEILMLRRSNEVLRAKVETMDLFALVLRTEPNYPQTGMSEDVAWLLGKEIIDIELSEGREPKPVRAASTDS